MKKYIIYIAIATFSFVACEPEFDNDIQDGGVYTSGEADFSNFISVGNSLTAGYADNALYREGQETSFPNIMAQQFKLVGGGEFRQPLMEDNLGGLKFSGNVILPNRLVLAVNEMGSPAPRPIAGDPRTDLANPLSGTFNNLGAPGAKSYHLLAEGYGNPAGVPLGQANPYYARFASSSTSSIMQDVAAQSPSFFSFWIGNNDILGYATSGGSGVNQQGNFDPSTYASNDITDVNVFESAYSTALDVLTASASGGVIFTIPNVTDIPFFTTVPVNPIPLDAMTAAGLNQIFGLYNTTVLGGLAQMGVISQAEVVARQVNFQEGPGNFVTMVDEELTNIAPILQGPPFNLPAELAAAFAQTRQANINDLITLTASAVIGNPVGVVEFMGQQVPLINGITVPLADQFVLTQQEQNEVLQAQAAYNGVIRQLAQANGLALVNADLLLQQVAEGGISYSSGVLTSQFATGGGFSLDGVHLTPRGYALLANEAIKSINETYGSIIPTVDIGYYRTIMPSNNVN